MESHFCALDQLTKQSYKSFYLDQRQKDKYLSCYLKFLGQHQRLSTVWFQREWTEQGEVQPAQSSVYCLGLSQNRVSQRKGVHSYLTWNKAIKMQRKKIQEFSSLLPLRQRQHPYFIKGKLRPRKGRYLTTLRW